MRKLEFFFDVGSPTAYLAWTQLPGLAREAGAELVYRPMLLGAVFQATGNASPVTVPAKGRYMGRDMARHAAAYGVPFAMNPHFPINTLFLMRVVDGIASHDPARLEDLLGTIFRGLWVNGVDMNSADTTAGVLAAAGFDPADMQALAADPAVKARLRATTDEAVARGVFGAPTMFVGDEMFFGQDRLEMVRAELRR